MRANTLSVVPAQAGTHNPWRSCFGNASTKIIHAFHIIGDTAYGSPEFTNEVQHFPEGVLRWDSGTTSFHWINDARLPDFEPTGARSGRLLQLWIARHRQSLAR